MSGKIMDYNRRNASMKIDMVKLKHGKVKD